MDSGDWSNALSWNGDGVTEPQSDDALSFGPCLTPSCYTTTDDLGPFTASNLSIADNLPYTLSGSDVELSLDPSPGEDGLDAAPASSTAGSAPGSPVISVPLALDDSQTWTVDGDGLGGGALSTWGVAGGSHTLGITLGAGGQLYLHRTVDTGGVTVTGADPQQGPTANGELGLFGDIDTTSDAPVVVDDVGLQLGDFNGVQTETGPMTVSDGAVTLGTSIDGGPGSTLVDGAFTIDPQSTMTVPLEGPGAGAGTDYGQLTATGDVNLAGDLTLVDDGSACQPATPGSVDTFITTTGGALSGQFANLPDGATTTMTAHCGDGVTDQYPIQINYTPTAMTGTFVGAGTITTESGGTGATGAAGTTGSKTPSGTAAGGGSAAKKATPTTSASGRSAAAGTGDARVAAPVTKADGAVDVGVSCAKGGASCLVRLQLLTTETTRHDKRVTHHTIVLGSRRVAIGAGDDRVSAVTLNPAGKRLLNRRRVLRARLVAAHWVSGHLRTMSSRKVTLRAPHR